jgi:hypothetical protein
MYALTPKKDCISYSQIGLAMLSWNTWSILKGFILAARLVNSIAAELDDRTQALTAQGKTHGEALQETIEACIVDADSLTSQVLALRKPAGVMSLKKFIDFYDENNDELPAAVNDRFVASMAHLGTALIAYGSSSRSRNRTIEHLHHLIDSLSELDSDDLARELMPILEGAPDFTHMGSDVRQYKLDKIARVEKIFAGFSRGD